ncbi:N-(5'-phosphoribosyl)anthranilate isomerase [[Candida] jaroonii]|uniref:N-(5'-phosphoribosyl)anthranilate isomerase n=1 Tax=[Candida] jaroonii TaxID=467808 RepID=A0ACA9Y221_9ASCO|nr:N-(5'-phosphoribosyl)anthranilate isomerase [[Candida] jaroonii]
MLVKVCGIKSLEIAQVAIENDVDLIGMIMLRGVKRSIDLNEAKRIVDEVKKNRKVSINDVLEIVKKEQFSTANDMLERIQSLIIDHGPFTVGVFRNQNIEEILDISSTTGIDIIQLHGKEDKLAYINELSKHGKVVIPRYVIPDDIELINTTLQGIFNGKYQGNGFLLPLLDGEMGGTGNKLDWSIVRELPGRFILAGGLDSDNVRSLGFPNLLGFDVSGGVETDGVKDENKVKAFIQAGKGVSK